MAWTSWSQTWQDDNEQETLEMQFEDYALKSNARAFASRSKAKAKPQRRTSASSSTKTLPIGERTWTDIEPKDYSLTDYPVSKKLINLLRHGSLLREDDGAIEFWRIKDYLQNHFVHARRWSDEKWKSIMARGGGNKKRFQYCTDSSGEILYLWALQGHSGSNLIDPSSQDNVLIPDDFFKYIYHVGWAINFIPSSIQDWYQEVKMWAKDRQYSFCLWILWIKNTKILRRSTWKHCVLHGTCIQHGRNIKTRCIGSTLNLLKRKD